MLNIITLRATKIFLLLSFFSLVACGGGGGGGSDPVVTDPVITGPGAAITFPSAQSLTDGDTVTLTGTAESVAEVTVVRVNGVDATSSDNYAHWSATLPLILGSNTLTVEVGDIALNTNMTADTATINRVGGFLTKVLTTALDSANDRVFVLDGSSDAVIAIDLTAGASYGTRSVVSNAHTPNAANPITDAKDMVLDSANNRLFVLGGSIISVDLNTATFGQRTIVANSNDFQRGIALDSANNRLLITYTAGLVYAVDLKQSYPVTATILSSNNSPNANIPFARPKSLAVDAVNERAIVVDGLTTTEIIAVDLRAVSLGERTLISNNSTPPGAPTFLAAERIAIDAANQRALITSNGGKEIIAVDLNPANLGARSMISSNTTPDSNNPFNRAGGMSIDNANNRALVADQELDGLILVDLTPGASLGARTLLSPVSTPNAQNTLFAPQQVVIDNANNRALLVDSFLKAVVAVDLTPGVNQGARSIVSAAGIPNNDNRFYDPFGIALDADNDRALVVDSSNSALYAVDLTPGANFGARTIISGSGVPDKINPFDGPNAVVIDTANNRALVTNDFGESVIAVDLALGTRTILSDNTTPDGNNAFGSPQGIVLDTVNSRALVVDGQAIVSVDLTPGVGLGTRTIFSNNSIPNNSNGFGIPKDIVIDSVKNRALVVDLTKNALFAVDLTPGVNQGARTIISDSNTPNSNTALIDPVGIALDSVNNRVLIVDHGLDALVLIDLDTGERVLLSH